MFNMRLLILLLLLSPFFAQTQKRLELVHPNAFSFYDYQEKAFCVLDDSSFLWKFNTRLNQWKKVPISLKIEMPFDQFLNDFIPMSDKGTPVYFVYAGCGVVYVKNGTVISRHDHSFYHMNQFGGSFFMDQGEPRIYGGYGLFTSKNIITRYDTIEKEWFMVNSGHVGPPTGLGNILQKEKDSYFVFDGKRETCNHFSSFTDVWRFDLNTKKWKRLGKMNPRCHRASEENESFDFQIQNKAYVVYQNSIIKFDFQQMKFKKYKFNSTGLYRNIIPVGNHILICKTNSKPSTIIEISDKHFFNQFEREEGEIILKEPETHPMVLISALCALLLILFFLWKRIKRKKVVKAGKKNQENRILIENDEFNHTEKELLQLLLKFNETGLEISHINDLVNHDNPSIDTLKKRREILLKDLRYKLSSKFNIPQEDVFMERRMETDKRMKLLYLNELIKNNI